MLKLDLKLSLDEIQSKLNIAEDISKDNLNAIGKHCHKGYRADVDSLATWTMQTKQIVELAKLRSTKKDTPYKGAADVKLPIVVSSVIQYAARTYSEIVRNGEIAHAAVLGEDPTGEKADRAKRVSKFMSYQLLFKDPNWEEDTDKLLNNFPLTGMAFRKTYYDPIKRQPRSETCLYDECVMSNYASSLEDARRISHILCVPRNEIYEKVQAGLYLDLDEEDLKALGGAHTDADDTFEIIEQHTFLDLDGDGYEEPYIVTFIEKTQTILRVVARWDSDGLHRTEKGEVSYITPVMYFTCYKFLPSPDGSFYGTGLGQLMMGIVSTSNTIINNLIDAGTWANMQGGIIDRSLNLGGGDSDTKFTFEPGEYKPADPADLDGDIRKKIFTIEHKEPSPTLLQLLGTLNTYGKEIASINEALTGDMQTQNVPATTALAVINQGSKVLGSIQRRLYRSLQQELDKLYRLNKLYLDDTEYFTFMDSQLAISKTDFEDQSIDIRPVADPNMASEVQRMQQAQALMVLNGDPDVNSREIKKMYIKSLDVGNIDVLVPPPNPNPPPSLPLVEMQAQLDMNDKKLQLDRLAHFLEVEKFKVLEEESRYKNMLVEAQAELAKAQAIAALNAQILAGNALEIERLAAKADMLAEPKQITDGMGKTKEGAPAPQPEVAEEMEGAHPSSPAGMGPELSNNGGLDGEQSGGIPPVV